MKEFENIGKGLTYKESPDYVERLVNSCRDAAVAKADASRHSYRPWFYGMTALAAAAAVAVGIFLWAPGSTSRLLKSSPIDKFLASLTDEEVAMIVDVPVDDIPEFD